MSWPREGGTSTPGIKGDTGPAGVSPIMSIGTVMQGAAAASMSGTTANPVLNLVLPKGDAGATGAASTVPGPAGAASTVPGPKGDKGDTGAASTVPGPTGPAGAASTVPGPKGDTGPAGTPGTIIQRTRAQSSATGLLTWTFPTPYAAGVVPVVQVSIEDATASATWGHQIVAVSNTGCTIQLSKSTAVTVLGISVLGIAANPQAYVHLYASAP